MSNIELESEIAYPKIEQYLRNMLAPQQEFFVELEKMGRETNVPLVQPDVAKLIQVILRTHKPKRILEIGAAIGFSSLLFANTLNSDVVVDTIEIDEKTANICEQNIKSAELQGVVKKGCINVILGDAGEVIKNLQAKYDFIFIDGPKGQYVNFLPDCKRLLNTGGLIFADNVFYRGAVAWDDSDIHRRKRHLVKRLRSFIKEICNDEQLDTSLIPIGDGVSISYLK